MQHIHANVTCLFFSFQNEFRLIVERVVITKTSPCNVNPLTPLFYIVKFGFTVVYIIFVVLL